MEYGIFADEMYAPRVSIKSRCLDIFTCVTFGLMVLSQTVNSSVSRSEQNAASQDRQRTTNSLQEFCLMETFRPQCLQNEVIVMEESFYGRRHVGKCIEADEVAGVEHDLRYLGCSVGVLKQLDVKCSGKKQCEVRVPDPDLEQTQPCRKGLKMFLEASYYCVEVVEEDRSCVVSLTSSQLHIAGPSSGPSVPSTPRSNNGLHCGTRTQPWLLEAPVGQRINVSLLDFTPTILAGVSSSINSRDLCSTVQKKNNYGYIIDKSASSASKKTTHICGGSEAQRQSHVYLSSSNNVEVVLNALEEFRFGELPLANFLLKVQAVGCTDLVPPEDAWVKREDDKIIIGCYTSRQTWQLRCQDGRWIGVVSNCTQGIPNNAASFEDIKDKRNSDVMESYQIATVIAIGFTGLAICLIIVCSGLVCLKRFYAVQGSKRAHQMEYKYVQPETVHRGQTVMTPNGV